MGRMLGAFASEELDRPDLNKCPDCGCFFAEDCCPLCGKLCPEEMRAGNRKAVKHKKRKNTGSGRVTFIEWYHSWWFIALMMLFFPLVGIILFVTSPYKKSIKITIGIIAVIYMILSTIGIGNIIGKVTSLWDKPVDTSMSRAEYIIACETVTPEDFYRSAAAYEDKFVTMTLMVSGKITDMDGYYADEKYTTYYICRDASGGEFEIMIRDCVQDTAQNFVAGDVITVWGEGAGNCDIYDMEYVMHSAPCVYVAYVERK